MTTPPYSTESFTGLNVPQESNPVRGTLTVLVRARCVCGIWKDLSPSPLDEDRPFIRDLVSDAMDEFDGYLGWTNLDTNPTCARCSEVAALRSPLAGSSSGSTSL